MWYSFSSKKKNTAVTGEDTGISESLMNTILKEGKGSLGKRKLCFFTHKGNKYVNSC
jgi:hypothetical protein